ncbi:hypothetical protein JCM11641_001497 [Rhodosporidiobolus odoratus]
MHPTASTSAAPHTHLCRSGDSYRPSATAVEEAHTFLQPDISTTTGTAGAGLPFETKHTGVTACRRVFVGPSFDGQGRKARPRAGSLLAGEGAGAGRGKERARESSVDEIADARAGFLPWRKRTDSTSTSRKQTGETIPFTSRKTSTAAQQTWMGSSFEIGGDVREAARRRDQRLKREQDQREKDEAELQAEHPRYSSAPAAPPPRSPMSTMERASFVTAKTHIRPPALANLFAENHPSQASEANSRRRPSEISFQLPYTASPLPFLTVDPASAGFVSAPASPTSSLPVPSPDQQRVPLLKSILRRKDLSFENGSALGHGHPSAPSMALSAPALLGIPESASLQPPTRPTHPKAEASTGTIVRFPSKLETRDGSGARPPLPPSVVLARSDTELDAAPEAYPPGSSRPRERSDDVIKTARMLVRMEWSQRDDLPDKFDEHVARKYPTTIGENWEELGVVWRRGGWIELWGEWNLNLPAIVLGRKKLKAVIPLRPKSTHISLYSSTDLVFCLTHRPNSYSVFSRSSRNTSARVPNSDPSMTAQDDGKDDTSRRSRRAKNSKRGYVHVRSNGTNVFLFRPRTHSTSKQWMWELHLALGGAIPRMVEISVPGLGAKVRMPVPHVEREDGEGETWAPMKASEVVDRCIEQLGAVREWSELVEDSKRQGAEFRLAWRRGSILDWIREDDPATRDWAVFGGGIAFRQDNQPEPVLELRPAMHYPTTCRIPASLTANPSRFSSTVRISEPPGMEGFLVRHRPNGVAERVYISSQMGLLFLCRPSTAHPPEPPIATRESLNNPAALVLAPFVFGMASLAAPSKKTQNEISRRVGDKGLLKKSSNLSMGQQTRRDWTVKSMDAARHECEGLGEKGGDAFLEWLEGEERRRAYLQITDARGFVKFSEIDSVEPELVEEDPREVRIKVEDLGGDEGLAAADDKSRLRKMRSFLIKTRAGRVVKFECHSFTVREEWVDRLRALSTYWHRRERVDACQLMELSPSSGLVNSIPPVSNSARQHAYDGPSVDDDGEPPLSRNEVLSSAHLSHFYNWCILDGCRAMMKQGIMHVKKGIRGTFHLRHVLLLPGTLIEYQSIARDDLHGQPLPTPYHRRRVVLSLRDCYVYSGSLASNFSSVTNPHNWHPGNEQEHQFPRCYPDTDGLRTADEAEDCTFVVVCMRHGGNGKLKKFEQEATSSRVYRTRSKLERDQFVYALNASIERLLRGEREREERLCDFSTWLSKHTP